MIRNYYICIIGIKRLLVKYLNMGLCLYILPGPSKTVELFSPDIEQNDPFLRSVTPVKVKFGARSI